MLESESSALPFGDIPSLTTMAIIRYVNEKCKTFFKKNQKNLQKPVDKGHTTCYNNQAVSRAKPAAAAAGAFTYSLYAVF